MHHQLFNKFVNLAEELDTENWMPIELLAKTAISHHQKDLAIAVYEAALKGKERKGKERTVCIENIF